MPYQQFPYTDFQNINLDWILKMIKKMGAEFAPKILESVNEWLNAHPEATTTVQDGSITPAKLQPSFLDDIVMQDDIKKYNKQYYPAVTKIGRVQHNSRQIQGIATDGEYLYLCGDNDPGEISVYVVHPSALTYTEHTITGIYGHANDACYFNGYLYITGCNNAPGNTVYTKLAKVNTRTWDAELIALPDGVGWWSVEMGKAFNGKYVLMGHRADTALIDCYSTIYAGEALQAGINKWLPWQTLNVGPFACDPAGMTQYGKYIMIGDAHLGTQLARNAVRVFTTDGDFKCNIYLDAMENNELEDICCIGSNCYAVDISGNVYTFPLLDIFGIEYDLPAFGIVAGNYGLKYAYISDNGSEVYNDLGGGTQFITSFRTIPFFYLTSSRIVDTNLVMPDFTIKGTVTENTNIIRYNGMKFDGTNFVYYSFIFTPSVPADQDEYVYTLTSANAEVMDYHGNVANYDTLADMKAAGLLSGNCYVRSIVYDNAPRYTFNTLSI